VTEAPDLPEEIHPDLTRKQHDPPRSAWPWPYSSEAVGADDIAMHSSGSGDRDATEAQDKATRQITEWFSEQRGSRNRQ